MENKGRRYELEVRLAGFLIVLVFLVVNVTGVWLINQAKQALYLEIGVRLGEALARAEAVEPGKAWSSPEAAGARLHSIAGLQGVAAAWVADISGKVLQSTGKPDQTLLQRLTRRLAGPARRQLAQQGKAVLAPGFREQDARAIYCYRVDGGLVAIAYSDDTVWSIEQASRLHVYIQLFIYSLVLLAGMLLARRIFLPFRDMAARARQAIQGKGPASDVDLVMATYGQMIEELKQRGQTMQELYQRSQTRTKDLEHANQQILDSIDKGVVTLDRKWVRSYNQAALRLLGVNTAEGMAEALAKHRVRPGARGSSVFTIDQGTDGSQAILSEASALRDQEGRELGTIVVLSDITEQQRQEEQARIIEQSQVVRQTAARLAERLQPLIRTIGDTADQATRERLEEIRGSVADLSRSLVYEPAKPAPEAGRLVVFRSELMARAMDLVDKVAPTDSTVLITGESGTGKELIAREIHRQSRRSPGPFVSVNCGALPETLLESELFGYIKGAFTGAMRDKAGLLQAAENGTFFLDEVSELSPQLQVKLLRAVQEREVTPVGGTKPVRFDARLVAATNQNLGELVRQGRFRQDLFYRLNVFEIGLPHLRQRPEDIAPLAERFLAQCCRKTKAGQKRLSKQSLALLEAYHWPGNVRELENVLERAVVLTPGRVIEPDDLNITIEDGATAESSQGLLSVGSDAAARAEAELIRKTLQQTRGNKALASRMLKISYRVMLKKIKDYRLET